MVDGTKVILKIRGRSPRTGGEQSWSDDTLFAVYCDAFHPTESGHFHGNFMVSDNDCQWDEVEIIGHAHG